MFLNAQQQGLALGNPFQRTNIYGGGGPWGGRGTTPQPQTAGQQHQGIGGFSPYGDKLDENGFPIGWEPNVGMFNMGGMQNMWWGNDTSKAQKEWGTWNGNQWSGGNR